MAKSWVFQKIPWVFFQPWVFLGLSFFRIVQKKPVKRIQSHVYTRITCLSTECSVQARFAVGHVKYSLEWKARNFCSSHLEVIKKILLIQLDGLEENAFFDCALWIYVHDSIKKEYCLGLFFLTNVRLLFAYKKYIL